jgi:hypothetical protein
MVDPGGAILAEIITVFICALVGQPPAAQIAPVIAILIDAIVYQ